MAMTQCPECKTAISDKAAACPHCGAPAATLAEPKHAVDPNAAAVYQNPRTQQHVDISSAWAWTLLFGPLYFLLRGVYLHAGISFAVALATGGLSFLVYPFFGQTIVRKHLLKDGWIATGVVKPVSRKADAWIAGLLVTLGLTLLLVKCAAS